jgi:hypothetical protein
VSHNHDNSFPIQDQYFVSPYTGQTLSLGRYISDFKPQGYDDHGYAQSQQGYNNNVAYLATGNQNQPDFIENQGLTTGLNHQAQFLGGQTNPFGVNVYQNPYVESPALYRPTSINAVYPSQTYSDATFADLNAADPSLCDPTASHLTFSSPVFPGQAFSGHTFSGPELPAFALSGQNFSADQYQPPPYQNIHLPTHDLHSNLIPDNPVLPATPPALQYTQPNCLAAFTRNADRIRHQAAVHGTNHRVHLCPILGCMKAQGRGYSRADKVTEHL